MRHVKAAAAAGANLVESCIHLPLSAAAAAVVRCVLLLASLSRHVVRSATSLPSLLSSCVHPVRGNFSPLGKTAD